ncbi:MAG: recombination protein RecR [Limnochordaceae bacterium]|nr:recombination protein RecR [Limnochordaceae bacterium]
MPLYPPPLTRLIQELGKLPGIGPKTAQRLALYLVGRPPAEVNALAGALVDARSKLVYCSRCFNITDVDPCRLCTDPRRDDQVLCVVEEPRDVFALERTGEFRGRYHVLHGAISPMEGLGPESLKIKELLRRLQPGTANSPQIQEVILATNSSVEGEATAMYLARLLKPLGVRVTRIAYGLPVGGDLDYVDEVTLSRALEGRRSV